MNKTKPPAKKAPFFCRLSTPFDRAKARFLKASEEWEAARLQVSGPTKAQRAAWDKARAAFDNAEHARAFGPSESPPLRIEPETDEPADPMENPPQYPDAPDWWPS